MSDQVPVDFARKFTGTPGQLLRSILAEIAVSQIEQSLHPGGLCIFCDGDKRDGLGVSIGPSGGGGDSHPDFLQIRINL